LIPTGGIITGEPGEEILTQYIFLLENSKAMDENFNKHSHPEFDNINTKEELLTYVIKGFIKD